MAINFPNSPSINDTYTSGGITYTWDGTKWYVATPVSVQGIQGVQGVSPNVTASNVGAVGLGVYKQKTGDNFEFKKLQEGNAVSLTDTGDTLSIGVPSAIAYDPYWANVEILLQFNGPDASTEILDATGRVWSTFGNAQLDTAQQKYGSASLLLDGTGDYLTTAHDAALSTNSGSGDFTMEAWIRLSALNRTHTISNKRDGSGAEEHSFQVISDNRLQATLWNGSPAGTVVSTSSLTTGVWYHVAFCRSGTTLYLFLDGVLQSTTTQTTSTSNTGVFHIGRDGFDSARDFQGWIGEYRFTKGVNRYTSSFTPPTSAFPTSLFQAQLNQLRDVAITDSFVSGSLLYNPGTWTNTSSASGSLTWNNLTRALTISSLTDAGIIINADTDDVTETDNPYILMTQDAAGIVTEFGISGNAGARAYNQAAMGGSGFAQNDAYIASNRNIHIVPGTLSSVGEINAFAFTTTRNWSFEPLRVTSATGNGTNYIDLDNTSNMVLSVRSSADAIIRLEADTDDIGEDDNPYIITTQDGVLTQHIQGFCGNSANTLPDGTAVSATSANDYVSMVKTASGMVLGSNSISMLRFANAGDTIYNLVPLSIAASTAASAFLRLPHGTTPTSPIDGDMWTTTAGLFARINSTSVQFLDSGRTISTTAPLSGGGDLSTNRTLSISTNGISDSLLRQSAARSLIGRTAGSTGNVADISASSGSDAVMRESGGTIGWGTIATAGISDNAVTLGKLATVSTSRILGRSTAGTGNVESLTGTQATALLDTFTSSLKGLAPSSGGGTDNYLRADGTWAVPPGAGVSANSFETITVTDTDGGSPGYTWSETGSIVAASPTSTMTLVSGTNIDIDVDTSTKAIRISSSASGSNGYPAQLGYIGGF